jgi:alpha-L-arabinofuranosidase
MVGFSNAGYNGFSVKRQKYHASFYVKGYSSLVNLALKSASSGQIFGSTNVTVAVSAWNKYTTSFTPTSAAPDVSNIFAVAFDASLVAGKSVYVDIVSLFPPTYKGPANGMRPDLVQVLAD